MKEAAFIRRNNDKWKKIEAGPKAGPDEIASQFIELTDDLAYARTFYAGSKTESYLNQLAAQKFLKIYKNKKLEKNFAGKFWFESIPTIIYQNRNAMFLSLLVFTVGIFIGIISSFYDETYARLILGEAYVNLTLENIAKGEPMGIYSRYEPGSSFLFITSNNIKVSFLAFVAGVIFSAGSAFILFTNGIMLGVFQYFFFKKGLLLTSALTIWIHGTLEITAIIIAGGAGMIMGNSLLFPGTFKRGVSFRKGAADGVKVITALVPVFIIAGFLEGFVTRQFHLPDSVKAGIIFLSLAAASFYFIVLPFKKSSKINNSQSNNYGKFYQSES
ncbi:MAG: stage II sporulation protein M [Lentimicrobium sp.]|nr:stage II sporulation protein M [Lentimicrobium sp.]